MTTIGSEGTEPVDHAEPSSTPEQVTEQDRQLQRGSVTLSGLIAQSVAAPAPEFSAVVTGSVIAVWVGGSAPFVFLIGAVIWLGLTRILYMYSKELADAGGIYTLMRSGLGDGMAIVGAWSYLVGVVVYVPGLSILSGYLLQSALAQIFPNTAAFTGSWVPWAAGFAVIAIGLGYTGVRISVRVILSLTVLGVAALTVLAVVILARGGAHGIAWQSLAPWTIPSSVGMSSIALAAGLGVSLFMGTETAVFLAEEAHAPRRMVPKAVVGAVLCLTVFYVVFALGIVTGYGFDEAGQAWSSASGNAVADLSNLYMFKGYGDFLLVILAISGLSSSIGVVNGSSRLIFSWGRLGILPGIAGTVHHKHKTPHVAVMAILVFSVAMIVAGVIWQGGGAEAATTVYAWLLIVGTFLLLVAFSFVAIAALVKGLRTRGSFLDVWVAPGVALLGMGLALFGNVHPFPAAPFDTAPYAALSVVVVGIVFALMRRRRPEVREGARSGESA